MVATSIGQAIPFSASSATSAATEGSGNAHVVPITWHKVKMSTSAKYDVFTRRIMRSTIVLAGPARLRCLAISTEVSMSSLLDSPLPFSATVMPNKTGRGVDVVVDMHTIVRSNRPPYPYASHFLTNLPQLTRTFRFSYFIMPRCILANWSASSAAFV